MKSRYFFCTTKCKPIKKNLLNVMDGIGKVDRNGKKYTMQISIVCTNIVASKALQNELIFSPILVHALCA